MKKDGHPIIGHYVLQKPAPRKGARTQSLLSRRPAFIYSPRCASASLARSEVHVTGFQPGLRVNKFPSLRYSNDQKLSGSQGIRHFRTIERSVGSLSSKNKGLKQSLECSPENSASRTNVSAYSPYQPMRDHQLSAATANCEQRLLSSYEIPTMPRL